MGWDGFPAGEKRTVTHLSPQPSCLRPSRWPLSWFQGAAPDFHHCHAEGRETSQAPLVVERHMTCALCLLIFQPILFLVFDLVYLCISIFSLSSKPLRASLHPGDIYSVAVFRLFPIVHPLDCHSHSHSVTYTNTRLPTAPPADVVDPIFSLFHVLEQRHDCYVQNDTQLVCSRFECWEMQLTSKTSRNLLARRYRSESAKKSDKQLITHSFCALVNFHAVMKPNYEHEETHVGLLNHCTTSLQ